ncbi:hypothetical protein [Nonomuraea dietziae]|uniref:hypothetical protein n=1 Tax=Nonomuraea dietziae TaxID=65515 RepID=UPI00343C2937
MRTFLRVAGLVLPGPTTLVAVYLADAWQVIIAIGVLAVLAFLASILTLAVSIRREERSGTLTQDPPGLGAALTRRMLNVHVRAIDDDHTAPSGPSMTRTEVYR